MDRKDQNSEEANNEGAIVESQGKPFVIPLFDEDADAEEEWYGPRVLTYAKEEIPDTQQAQEAMRQVLRAEELLLESQRRGDADAQRDALRRVLKDHFIELSKIMGDWRDWPEDVKLTK